MATTDKQDLKAFIRIDGSGREIAGSLILRKSKPKVGNWREVTAYLCCTPTTTTTTSTSTSTTTSTSTSTTSTTTTAPSDIRLKRNIVLTGAMRGSLPEYSWEWNEIAVNLKLNSYPTIGVIAQEALEAYPKSVSIGEDGYYRVNYSLIK